MPCAIVARRSESGHVIYDEAMRRVLSVSVGALAFVAMTALAWAASAGDTTPTSDPLPSTTTTGAPTTTSPPPVTAGPTTSTTGASAKRTTTTTTSATTTTKGAGAPVPPPASGASQPLDPSLVGGSIVPIDTTTTLFGVEPTTTSTTSTTAGAVIGLSVNNKKNGPSGPTLGFAAVAWLASLGGLLVYAEDQRAKQWRHLAR